MKEVKLEFYHTEAEYLAASRLFLTGSGDGLFRLILFMVALLIGFFIVSTIVLDFPLWATLLVTLMFEASILYNLLVRAPRQYFRGDAKFRDKYDLTFSDAGIAVKTSKIDSKLAWSLYTKVIEGPAMYLLIYGKQTRMMTMVPKRAFQSRQQEDSFREIVTRHISEHATLRAIRATEETPYTPTNFSPPDWR